jgi:phosphoenolpyruvate---glycerone phosphotransferase subunit DhaL
VKGDALVALVDAALERLTASRDELRDLDAALGDGDLGITVVKGCDAVRSKLAELTDPVPAQVIRTAATAFATANPSTMAALVGGGLLAGAKSIADVSDLRRGDAVRFARAVADSIATKGKAQPGDKTMLDALIPSIEVLEDQDRDDAEVLTAMVDAARRAVEETAPLQSRRGRASWIGERSSGHPDPGATAYLRFLEALAEQWDRKSASEKSNANSGK